MEPVDILFLAQPHGQTQHNIEEYTKLASKIIDLAADFRLRDAGFYKEWYGEDHAAPEWLSKFVYGLPELHREELKTANYVSGVGCNATASNLALLPLVKADLIDLSSPVIIELKVGSSEGGAGGNAGSLHAERANVIRTFSAFGHRHTAEVIQELGVQDISLTMTAVDLVRGVLGTAHAKVKEGVANKDLWKAYRTAANENPFIRVVKEQRGIYRVPEPKILAGSNYADLGFGSLKPYRSRRPRLFRWFSCPSPAYRRLRRQPRLMLTAQSCCCWAALSSRSPWNVGTCIPASRSRLFRALAPARAHLLAGS
jgi:N-acetyl-gamma-glutamyl-phosphate/LysW-gamma-L-alpha-aminoadipyl-6-phosphate reductase